METGWVHGDLHAPDGLETFLVEWKLILVRWDKPDRPVP